MPNTKVRWLPGLTGGVVTALLFLLWIGLCKALQIGVAGYGRIYGSFAFVPIVLAWVYVSWEIVLFGAELAFAVQNCTTYRMERGAREASVQARLMLALSVAMEAGRAMLGQVPKFEVAAFARERRVSVRFLNDVVEHLVHARLLGELTEEAGRYVLVRAPGSVTVKDVLDSVLETGVAPQDLGLGKLEPSVAQTVRTLSNGCNGDFSRTTIEDLLARS